MASQYRRRSLMLNTIAKVAQGNPTIITDSSSRRLKKLNIYGQSSQDGTPTHESPIEIISKEVSEIKLTGKNKLPFPFKLFTEERTIEGVTFTPLENGGIKINGTSTNMSFLNLDNYPYEKGYTYTLWYENGAEYQQSVNSMFIGHDSDNEFVYINIPSAGITYNNLVLYPMQSLENVSNSYEPYKEQKITLSDPITLRGIPVSSDGNITIDGQQYISDCIKEKDGVIGVERNTQELLVSSMNKLYLTLGTHTNGQPYLACNNEDKDTYIRAIKPFCNRYIGSFFTTDNGKVYIPNVKGFIINDNRFTDKDTAISIITDEETKVLLALLNSTFEPLPEADQEAIRKLKTFYPNTVIQTGCWNEVTYSAKRGG